MIPFFLSANEIVCVSDSEIPDKKGRPSTHPIANTFYLFFLNFHGHNLNQTNSIKVEIKHRLLPH